MRRHGFSHRLLPMDWCRLVWHSMDAVSAKTVQASVEDRGRYFLLAEPDSSMDVFSDAQWFERLTAPGGAATPALDCRGLAA